MAPAFLFTVILATLPHLVVFAGDSSAITCKTISSAISNSSAIFHPGSAEYASANSHWANSSSAQSACAVEPGTANDLAKIVKILGSTRTHFGVKSGGHATNPGFSSTSGVQIYLSRFSHVEYNNATSTVRVGPGLIWDDVYAALEPHGVIVAGGRVSGIGVGGLATGGGYSSKSNQVGLTIDTITAYELVLPNGTVATVTEATHPDLFFGLKGGFTNFGIVTSFTFKTYPQTQVWGGFIIFAADQFQAVSNATKHFSDNNKDPKASLRATYNYIQGSADINLSLFYDAPQVANGIFDEFLAIPSVSREVSTRSYLSLTQAQAASDTAGAVRAAFHSVSVLKYSQKVLDVVANETTFWGAKLQAASAVLVSYDIEPYYGYSTHATPSAYPHNTSLLPVFLYFSWTNPTQDHTIINAMKQSVQTIYNAALSEGQDISIEHGKQIRYPNHALFDTPLEQMYGANVGRLRHLRAQHDPKNVMSLAGGFRF